MGLFEVHLFCHCYHSFAEGFTFMRSRTAASRTSQSNHHVLALSQPDISGRTLLMYHVLDTACGFPGGDKVSQL